MDKHAAALTILRHALPHVPFDGWSAAALARGGADAGYTAQDLLRVFPGGAAQALRLFTGQADARMEREFASLPPPEKIRARIAALVRLRLQIYGPYQEAVRRALSYFALHPAQGAATLARTADAMWRAAGDTSTDFNWYTKRALLSGVYAGTLLYWLNDDSEGNEATWAFLDRRIADVMKIQSLKMRAMAYAR